MESANVSEQLVFARFNFDHHQALIRFLDTKAGGIVTLMIFLGATAIPVARDAVHNLSMDPGWRLGVSTAFVASGVGFAAAFICVLGAVEGVIRPRAARQNAQIFPGNAPLCPRKDLLWQDHVLAHGSEDEYFQAVAAADAALILRNLTDHVFELASICREKMGAVRRASLLMWWVFACWAGILLTGFVLLR